MIEYLDENGYPNDKAILELRRYNLFGDKFSNEYVFELIDFIKNIWCYNDGVLITQEGNCLEMHTFGWSGNEIIIKEIESSFLWLCYWKKTVIGGHYYFGINKDYKDYSILLEEKIKNFSSKLEGSDFYEDYLKYFEINDSEKEEIM